MKKIAGFALSVLIAIALAPKPAEAQIILCGYCCDGNGVARCSGIQLPCGTSCVCYGIPGYGYSC